MNNEELIKQIKQFFEKEALSKNKELKQFSDDVVNYTYQKLSANILDTIRNNEEDPMVLAEILEKFLNVTKMVDERGLQKQQFLLKLFEQLNKYEQSRYY